MQKMRAQNPSWSERLEKNIVSASGQPCSFSMRGHDREPARHDVIQIAAGAVLYVGHQMKDGVGKFAMAVPRHFREAFDQDLRFPGHHFGNQVVAKIGKKFRVARKKSAIEKGKDRLRIFGIEWEQIGKQFGRDFVFQSHMAQLFREMLNRLPAPVVRVLRLEKKEQINIGIGEKRLPAEISDGEQHNARDESFLGRKELLREAKHDRFRQRRSPARITQSVLGDGKFLLQPRGFERRITLSVHCRVGIVWACLLI